MKALDELAYEEEARQTIRMGKFPELLIATLSENNFTVASRAELKIANRAFKRVWEQHLKALKDK